MASESRMVDLSVDVLDVVTNEVVQGNGAFVTGSESAANVSSAARNGLVGTRSQAIPHTRSHEEWQAVAGQHVSKKGKERRQGEPAN